MYVVCVNIQVKAQHRDAFVQATLDNARHTRAEPGNLRFDVLGAQDDPCRFMLYEVYRSPDDFAAHQQTQHYFRWRNAAGDWMAQPRTSGKYAPLFFGDAQA